VVAGEEGDVDGAEEVLQGADEFAMRRLPAAVAFGVPTVQGCNGRYNGYT